MTDISQKKYLKNFILLNKMKIISRGAEAIIFEDNNTLIKERIKKNYRIKEIDDKIRKLRTRNEARLLERASKIINVPKVIDSSEKDAKIIMEMIAGNLLRDNLNKLSKDKLKKVCNLIGKNIKELHDNGIIHGDLTTSNIFFVKDEIYFIDFGLGFISDLVEHKAVDIHLLKQALESKHHNIFEESFKEVLSGYNPDKEFLVRLGKVEGRGRYKKAL